MSKDHCSSMHSQPVDKIAPKWILHRILKVKTGDATPDSVMAVPSPLHVNIPQQEYQESTMYIKQLARFLHKRKRARCVVRNDYFRELFSACLLKNKQENRPRLERAIEKEINRISMHCRDKMKWISQSSQQTMTSLYPAMSPFKNTCLSHRYACYDFIEFYIQSIYENTQHKGHWSSYRTQPSHLSQHIYPIEHDEQAYYSILEQKLSVLKKQGLPSVLYRKIETLIQLDKEVYYEMAFIQHALFSLGLMVKSLESCRLQEALHLLTLNVSSQLKTLLEDMQMELQRLIPNRQEYQCVVCLDIMYKPVYLSKCGHSFCAYCLAASFKNRPSCLNEADSPYVACCPLCRTQFRIDSSRDIKFDQAQKNFIKAYFPREWKEKRQDEWKRDAVEIWTEVKEHVQSSWQSIEHVMYKWVKRVQ